MQISFLAASHNSFRASTMASRPTSTTMSSSLCLFWSAAMSRFCSASAATAAESISDTRCARRECIGLEQRQRLPAARADLGGQTHVAKDLELGAHVDDVAAGGRADQIERPSGTHVGPAGRRSPPPRR